MPVASLIFYIVYGVHAKCIHLHVFSFNFRCLMTPENSDPQFQLEYRGPVSMKGKKEPMQVWFLSRKSTETEV